MGSRPQKPTKRGNPPPQSDYSDDAPTSIYDSGERSARSTDAPRAQPAPKIQAISMKTPASPKVKPVEKPDREMPHVKLRAMSEVARAQQTHDLGNLAPPYDAAEARKRTVRDYVVWGSLAVILASAIALVVWFVGT